MADCTVDFDVTAILLDDAVYGRKSESGAFANGLCGVEGVEDLGCHLLGHTAAGVGDGDGNVIAWCAFFDRVAIITV